VEVFVEASLCTICKSFAHRSRQITTPAPHHSVFYGPDALPDAQPTVSRHCYYCVNTRFIGIYLQISTTVQLVPVVYMCRKTFKSLAVFGQFDWSAALSWSDVAGRLWGQNQ